MGRLSPRSIQSRCAFDRSAAGLDGAKDHHWLFTPFEAVNGMHLDRSQLVCPCHADASKEIHGIFTKPREASGRCCWTGHGSCRSREHFSKQADLRFVRRHDANLCARQRRISLEQVTDQFQHHVGLRLVVR